MLGIGEELFGVMYKDSVFSGSTLEDITVPATLKVIRQDNFDGCKNLKKIKFLEGREKLGENEEETSIWNKIFRDCGVEEITLPGTLKEMSPDLFKDCYNLKTVGAVRGCKVKIKKFVGDSVKVLRYKQQRKSHDIVQHRSYMSIALRVLGLLFLSAFVF